VNVTLKWPNDVIVEAPALGPLSESRVPGSPRSWRKVAGILAEATSSGNALQFVVVGIGVNVRSAVWPPEVAARAASLEGFTRRAIDRDSVLVELLTALAEQRTALVDGGAPVLLDRWRALAPSSQGHRVTWETPDGPRTGLTAGIDAAGALLVRTPQKTERIVAGELSWE
jgi:BirA family biotin operon repressor/biotin-[acetyl-CoA-carboxylase] ligase